MSITEDIAYIRKKVDAIDSEILVLLQKRLAHAKEIGTIKKSCQNDSSSVQLRDPAREKEIYTRLLYDNKNKFPEHSLQVIFHEIIATCRNIQKKE